MSAEQCRHGGAVQSFGFKGTRWTSGIAADGHRAATPVCPEHDHREAKVLVALNEQVLVWCPDCGPIDIYSKEDFESRKRDEILRNNLE